MEGEFRAQKALEARKEIDQVCDKGSHSTANEGQESVGERGSTRESVNNSLIRKRGQRTKRSPAHMS